MSLKPTLHLPWLEFIKLDSISSLPINEQTSVFRKMTDPNQVIPWLTFKEFPHIVDLSLPEQAQYYRKYIDELDKVRLDQLRLANEQENKVITPQYDNLNWLLQRQGQGAQAPPSGSISPPHIILEDGSNLLLEDKGLILIE